MAASARAMVDAGLNCLIAARKRDTAGSGFDDDDRRRLEIAITAAHAVVEPLRLPTDELRAMGLWFEDSYLERMHRERVELEDKIGKLLAFVETSDVFTRLPNIERDRLREQLEHMQAYGSVLAARVRANE